jgi:hypothetical protein
MAEGTPERQMPVAILQSGRRDINREDEDGLEERKRERERETRREKRKKRPKEAGA